MSHSLPVFKRISEKTTEISKRLGRQARPGVEPGTSRFQVFECRIAQPLAGPKTGSLASMPYPRYEPGTFGAAASFSSNHTACSAVKFRIKWISTDASEIVWETLSFPSQIKKFCICLCAVLHAFPLLNC